MCLINPLTIVADLVRVLKPCGYPLGSLELKEQICDCLKRRNGFLFEKRSPLGYQGKDRRQGPEDGGVEIVQIRKWLFMFRVQDLMINRVHVCVVGCADEKL